MNRIISEYLYLSKRIYLSICLCAHESTPIYLSIFLYVYSHESTHLSVRVPIFPHPFIYLIDRMILVWIDSIYPYESTYPFAHLYLFTYPIYIYLPIYLSIYHPYRSTCVSILTIHFCVSISSIYLSIHLHQCTYPAVCVCRSISIDSSPCTHASMISIRSISDSSEGTKLAIPILVT